MSNDHQLPTIASAALAQVSGGATTTTTSSDQILTTLTSILQQIQALATQPRSSGFSEQEMLMLVMMMQRNQQGPTPWPWSQPPILRYE